mmetsp:Transcript_13899/g.33287  ORF Transcript_13899/g.33287 Transcript_13899/m.33287 type:complete len:347 (-) Transcript_13899:663-1703(-)
MRFLIMPMMRATACRCTCSSSHISAQRSNAPASCRLSSFPRERFTLKRVSLLSALISHHRANAPSSAEFVKRNAIFRSLASDPRLSATNPDQLSNAFDITPLINLANERWILNLSSLDSWVMSRHRSNAPAMARFSSFPRDRLTFKRVSLLSPTNTFHRVNAPAIALWVIFFIARLSLFFSSRDSSHTSFQPFHASTMAFLSHLEMHCSSRCCCTRVAAARCCCSCSSSCSCSCPAAFFAALRAFSSRALATHVFHHENALLRSWWMMRDRICLMRSSRTFPIAASVSTSLRCISAFRCWVLRSRVTSSCHAKNAPYPDLSKIPFKNDCTAGACHFNRCSAASAEH